MWLWCIDRCHESVMCVGVQCGKTLLFYHKQGGIFHQKGPKRGRTHDGFGPSLSRRRSPGKRSLRCPKHEEKHRAPTRKRLKACEQPCVEENKQCRVAAASAKIAKAGKGSRRSRVLTFAGNVHNPKRVDKYSEVLPAVESWESCVKEFERDSKSRRLRLRT